MGNTLSSTPTPDKLKDQIFSIVLYYVAPKANPNLKFALRDNCSEHNLPIPEQADYESLLDFYNTNDMQVYRYLQNHVLNSQENTTRFYQTLINKLAPPKSKKLMNEMIEAKILQSREASLAGNEQHDLPGRLTRSQLDQISEFESGQSLIESDYGLFGGSPSPRQQETPKSQTSRTKSTIKSQASKKNTPTRLTKSTKQVSQTSQPSQRSRQVSLHSQQSLQSQPSQQSQRSQRSQRSQSSQQSQPSLTSQRSQSSQRSQPSQRSQSSQRSQRGLKSKPSQQVSERSQTSRRSERRQDSKASQQRKDRGGLSEQAVEKEEDISSGFYEPNNETEDLRSPGYSEDEFTIPNESELEKYLGNYESSRVSEDDEQENEEKLSEDDQTDEKYSQNHENSQQSHDNQSVEQYSEDNASQNTKKEEEEEEQEDFKSEPELEPSVASNRSHSSSIQSSRSRYRRHGDESTLSVPSEYRNRNRFGKKCMIKD